MSKFLKITEFTRVNIREIHSYYTTVDIGELGDAKFAIVFTFNNGLPMEVVHCMDQKDQNFLIEHFDRVLGVR